MFALPANGSSYDAIWMPFHASITDPCTLEEGSTSCIFCYITRTYLYYIAYLFCLLLSAIPTISIVLGQKRRLHKLMLLFPFQIPRVTILRGNQYPDCHGDRLIIHIIFHEM